MCLLARQLIFCKEKAWTTIELSVQIILGSQLTGLDFFILISVLQQYNSTDLFWLLSHERMRFRSTEYFVRQGLGSPLLCIPTAQTEMVWSQYKNCRTLFHIAWQLITMKWGESKSWLYGNYSCQRIKIFFYYYYNIYIFLMQNAPLKVVKGKMKTETKAKQNLQTTTTNL